MEKIYKGQRKSYTTVKNIGTIFTVLVRQFCITFSNDSFLFRTRSDFTRDLEVNLLSLIVPALVRVWVAEPLPCPLVLSFTGQGTLGWWLEPQLCSPQERGILHCEIRRFLGLLLFQPKFSYRFIDN